MSETSRQALLILDVQQDFTGPDARMPVDRVQAAVMIDRINRLVDERSTNGLEPIYIVNEFPRFSIANLFRNFAAIKGRAGSALDPRLHVVAAGSPGAAGETRFAKRHGNAFTNPLLHPYLQQHGIDSLLVTGLFAGACVRATIKSALRLGYKVSVIPEAIAAGSEAARARALRAFRTAGVQFM